MDGKNIDFSGAKNLLLDRNNILDYLYVFLLVI